MYIIYISVRIATCLRSCRAALRCLEWLFLKFNFNLAIFFSFFVCLFSRGVISEQVGYSWKPFSTFYYYYFFKQLTAKKAPLPPARRDVQHGVGYGPR